MPLLPLHKRAFILLLIAVTIGFGLVLQEYAVAIFWGVAFAIVFAPLHRKLLERLPQKPTLAALATLLISLVMVIFPLVLIACLSSKRLPPFTTASTAATCQQAATWSKSSTPCPHG